MCYSNAHIYYKNKYFTGLVQRFGGASWMPHELKTVVIFLFKIHKSRKIHMKPTLLSWNKWLQLAGNLAEELPANTFTCTQLLNMHRNNNKLATGNQIGQHQFNDQENQAIFILLFAYNFVFRILSSVLIYDSDHYE